MERVFWVGPARPPPFVYAIKVDYAYCDDICRVHRTCRKQAEECRKRKNTTKKQKSQPTKIRATTAAPVPLEASDKAIQELPREHLTI
jgi:hypothetical protein|mmetsp:Transcript_3502/g.6737  ORF Transcript_3502/g.6737 Transcript_3502/m.6737 type:complete len:88 (+) Transcript_3502:53-316(+)